MRTFACQACGQAVYFENWLPLTFAVNSLNRSMGQQDLYPFVLPRPAIDKLAYVHGVVRESRDSR
jgi:hypothetical protein